MKEKVETQTVYEFISDNWITPGPLKERAHRRKPGSVEIPV